MSTAKKQSEVDEEMERMFGPEDEFGLNPLDKMRLKLVQKQYKKSNLIYRMIFDKNYRPDRYNCIVNTQQKFRNINEFRTYVMSKYYTFPITSI